jgi:hypothetical protein
MTKKELIDALTASDVPDDAEVVVFDSKDSEYLLINSVEEEAYDTTREGSNAIVSVKYLELIGHLHPEF